MLSLMSKQSLQTRFEKWVIGIQADLLAYASSILGNHDMALDVTQEALMQTFRQLRQGRDITSWKSYTYAVLRRFAIRQRQSQHQQKPMSAQDLQAIYATSQPAWRDDFEHLMHHLNDFKPDLKEIVVLKAMNSLTFKEISEITGTPMQTVVSKYKSAITQLKSKLN
ncbi:RNA polymerase sigma factor [Planctomycetota bacterium]